MLGKPLVRGSQLVALGLVLGLTQDGTTGDTPRRPVRVQIQDDKPVIVEPVLPVDPVKRIQYQPSGNLSVGIRDERNQSLHLSHYPTFNINGQVVGAGMGAFGQIEVNNAPLPRSAGGKERIGFMSVCKQGDLRITMTAELVPTKPADRAQKRRLDSMLIRYQIENKGKQAHKVGLRIYMDTYVIDNDGCLFAAPTHPGKVLDGIELKDKTLPDYVQLLQRPNLKDPGYVAHLTVNLGSKIERPNRVVLTQHGAGFNGWDMPAQMAGGDSALGVFWEPVEIKPGAQRDLAYAYGQGIAVAPENEGRLNIELGGSFEPGKVFTIAALVQDPVRGQTLTLALPPGMERVEGKSIQPVPAPTDDAPQCFVMWKARVLQTGRFPIQIRSSTGVTQTKIVTITESAE